jgi:hypothetical protein
MQGIRALSEIALVVLVVTGGRLGDIHGGNIIFLVGPDRLHRRLALVWICEKQAQARWSAGQYSAAALTIPQVLATSAS